MRSIFFNIINSALRKQCANISRSIIKLDVFNRNFFTKRQLKWILQRWRFTERSDGRNEDGANEHRHVYSIHWSDSLWRRLCWSYDRVGRERLSWGVGNLNVLWLWSHSGWGGVAIGTCRRLLWKNQVSISSLLGKGVLTWGVLPFCDSRSIRWTR